MFLALQGQKEVAGGESSRGDYYPYVQLTVEPVSILGISFEAIPRKESIGGERDADVCRFGQVQGS